MGDPARRLHCREHGEVYATFVCQHIAQGSAQGFNYGNPADPRPDAWCDACDRVRLQHGGEWNDASETHAGITLLCSACYDRARARNERRGLPVSRRRLGIFALALLSIGAVGLSTTACARCTPAALAAHDWRCGCVPFGALAPEWVSWPVAIGVAWGLAVALTPGNARNRRAA